MLSVELAKQSATLAKKFTVYFNSIFYGHVVIINEQVKQFFVRVLTVHTSLEQAVHLHFIG